MGRTRSHGARWENPVKSLTKSSDGGKIKEMARTARKKKEKRMVYTVTLNPAVDYYVYTDELRVGTIERAKSERISFGGKGINVSRVLTALGVENKALGFLAGFTGRAIEEALNKEGLSTDFCFLSSGTTRINVKIRHGRETDVNGIGANISLEEVGILYERFRDLRDGDVLMLLGSVPEGLPKEVYRDILLHFRERNIYTVVDAEGELLLKTLQATPFLVKPNREELALLLGRPLTTERELLDGAKELQTWGARNVLLSLGKDGALLLLESGEAYRIESARGECVNSVGAGDAMLAGFLAEYLSSEGDALRALRFGTAAGSATAFREGFATKREIEATLSMLGDAVRVL